MRKSNRSLRSLFCFLLPFLCLSLTGDINKRDGFTIAGGSGTPSGTYMFWYNGDHPTDADTAWFNSGAGYKAGSVGAGTSVTTDYVEASTSNEHVSWTNSSSDIFSDSQGTIFLTVYVPDQGSGVRDNYFFEAYVNTNNFLSIRTQNTGDNVRADFRGNAGTQQNIAAGTLSVDTWYRVGYSWQTGAGAAGQHAIIVAAQETAIASWSGSTDETEDIDDFGSDPSEIAIGEDSAFGGSITDGIRIKDVIITSGYKDADQL